MVAEWGFAPEYRESRAGRTSYICRIFTNLCVINCNCSSIRTVCVKTIRISHAAESSFLRFIRNSTRLMHGPTIADSIAHQHSLRSPSGIPLTPAGRGSQSNRRNKMTQPFRRIRRFPLLTTSLALTWLCLPVLQHGQLWNCSGITCTTTATAVGIGTTNPLNGLDVQAGFPQLTLGKADGTQAGALQF